MQTVFSTNTFGSPGHPVTFSSASSTPFSEAAMNDGIPFMYDVAIDPVDIFDPSRTLKLKAFLGMGVTGTVS